jgi:hypothetical protein
VWPLTPTLLVPIKMLTTRGRHDASGGSPPLRNRHIKCCVESPEIANAATG